MAAVGQYGEVGVELVQGDAARPVLVFAEAAISEYDGATLDIVCGDFRFGGTGQYQGGKPKCQYGGAAHRSGPKEHVQDHALSPGPFPVSASSVTQKSRANKIGADIYRACPPAAASHSKGYRFGSGN